MSIALNETNVMLDNEIILAKKYMPCNFFLAKITGSKYWVFSNITLIYVLKGVVSLKTYERTKDLRTNDIFFIESNRAFMITNKEENLLIILQITPEYFKESKQHYFNNDFNSEIKMSIINAFGDLFLESLSESNLLSKKYTLLDNLILHLKKAYLKKSLIIPLDSEKCEVRKIISSIVENSSRENNFEFQLKDLSEEYNISLSHLSRSFKKITGQNITVFFRKKRINQAVNLLINSNLNITNIARESGFPDIKAMSRDLNKEFGLPATKIRSKYSDLIQEYMDVILSDTSYVEDFISSILSRNKDQTVRNFSSLTQANIDVESPAENLGMSWTDSLDLESLIQDNFGEISDLFISNFKVKKIRIRLQFIDGNLYYFGKNGNLKYLTTSIMTQMINIFSLYKIYPIFSFFINKLEPIFAKYSEVKVKTLNTILDEIYKKSPSLDLSNWAIELHYKKVESLLMDQSNMKILLENLSLLKVKLSGSLLHGISLGLNIGSYEVKETKKNLNIIENLSFLKNKLDFLSFEGFYVANGNSKSDYHVNLFNLKEFVKKIKYLLSSISSNILEENIYLDLTYIINRQDNYSDLENPYFYKGYLYLLSNLLGKNIAVISSKIKYLELNQEVLLDHFNIYNEFGLPSVNYHIKKFLSSLSSELIYKNDNIIFTRNIDSYIGIVYGNLQKKTINDELVENISLSFSNIYGSYKQTISKITDKTYFFYKNWIKFYRETNLTKEEKEFIRAKSLPELSLEYHMCTGKLDIELKLLESEIYLIKLEKINYI